jgi:hypothetical protein
MRVIAPWRGRFFDDWGLVVVLAMALQRKGGKRLWFAAMDAWFIWLFVTCSS